MMDDYVTKYFSQSQLRRRERPTQSIRNGSRDRVCIESDNSSSVAPSIEIDPFLFSGDLPEELWIPLSPLPSLPSFTSLPPSSPPPSSPPPSSLPTSSRSSVSRIAKKNTKAKGRTSWIFKHMPDEDQETRYWPFRVPNTEEYVEWRCKYCTKVYQISGGTAIAQKHLIRDHDINNGMY